MSVSVKKESTVSLRGQFVTGHTCKFIKKVTKTSINIKAPSRVSSTLAPRVDALKTEL